MRKKIRSETNSKARVTAEPYFDVLNGYFKEVLSGKKPEYSKEVQEAVEVWVSADCENCNGSNCLFSKHQDWINNLDTNAWDLCDLIEMLSSGKLKQNRRVDLMDVPGLIAPGSAFSRKS